MSKIEQIGIKNAGGTYDMYDVGSTDTDTDRYVNSASFADDTSNNSSNPVKMTLTRAGSDSNTVTANLPKVSSTSAGVAPKGASVTSQSQSTKFLREDGTWAAPSYTTNTNTTYTFATGDSNGQIKVTPSSGSAQNVSVKGLGSAAYTPSSDYVASDIRTNLSFSVLETVLENALFNSDSSLSYYGSGLIEFTDPNSKIQQRESYTSMFDILLSNIGIFKDTYGPIRIVTGANALGLIGGSSASFNDLGSGFEGRVFLLGDEILGAVIDKLYYRVQADSSGAVSSTFSFNQYLNFDNFGVLLGSKGNGYPYEYIQNAVGSAVYRSTSSYLNVVEDADLLTDNYLTVGEWSISGSPGATVSISTSSPYPGYANMYFYVRCPHKIVISGNSGLFTKDYKNKVNNMITYGTSDYTPGTTSLTTGTIYCQYEA